MPKSNEHILGTPEGIKTARTVKRRPMNERWNKEEIDAFRGKPWCWKPEKEEAPVQMEEPEVAPPTMPEGHQEAVRRVHIRGHHVRAHGPTRGCDGCMAAMNRRKARNHTEPCRNRFMKIFEATPEGRERIEKVEERKANRSNLAQNEAGTRQCAQLRRSIT